MLPKLLFCLSVIWISIAHASAPPTCSEIFRAVPVLAFQSSVELEIGATPMVIELFDTLDGTIRPVAGKIEAIPENLREQLQGYVGEGRDVLDAPWDVMTPEEKIALLTQAAVVRGQDFHKDRKVPGLKYRPMVQLTFAKPTRFLGYDYPAGVFSVASSEIFGVTKIEYMGPNRMKDDLGVELHVRSSLLAGENQMTARALQNALIRDEQNLHEHIVAEAPVAKGRVNRFFSWLRRSIAYWPMTRNAYKTFRAADFVRRTMLYFDIKMIENGISMTPIKVEDERGGTNFGPVRNSDFSKFIEAMLGRGWGEDTKVISKSGTVGLRTHHFYDQDLWGIEVRYLSPRLSRDLTAHDLNVFQMKMIDQSYFMSEKEVRDYAGPIADFHSITMKLLYTSDYARRFAFSGLTLDQYHFVMKEVEANDFIKMLFHDWSQDPMFYRNEKRIEQIKKAQRYCLQLLLRGMPSTEVMKTFVKKSAIGYEIRQLMLRDEPSQKFAN